MELHMQNEEEDFPLGAWKATSQQEIIDWERLTYLPLISDGLYPPDRSMMEWVEMEMVWKYS